MGTPKIAFHGGKCCGIKVIHTLGDDPEAMAEELESQLPLAENIKNADQYGNDVSSSFNFFVGKAPKETYLARVDRYIEYLKAVRPQGIIEIVLADNESDRWDDQISPWKKLIEERGFNLVSDCHNSNSGNRVYVFHKLCDDE